MNDVLLIVDVDMIGGEEPNANLIRQDIKRFRASLPFVPTVWLDVADVTDFDTSREKFGVLGKDFVFTKPYGNATLDGAVNANGIEVIDWLAKRQLRNVYIVGATFYGSVLGAGQSLKAQNAGFKPCLVTDLTDYARLTEDDHIEANTDFGKAAIPLINSQQLRQRLTLNSGAPHFKF